MVWWSRLFVALWLLLSGPLALAEVPVPALQARVTDLTETLNAAQRDALERNLAALEQAKGAQIAVLLVPTTQPESIEQYARRVLDVWKLGRKGVDDGALLLIAKDDRALRIETQYGLEGVIPDAVAKRIISEDITPHFKRGDFYGGIEAGISRMIRLVQGEALPPPPQKQQKQSGMRFLEDNFVLFAIFVVVFGGLLRSLFGQLLGAGVASGLVAVVVWLVTSSLLFVIITSFITFIVVLVGVGRGGGGWSSGGGGGGWSSGGGGWSGGGGMGGGGGASGNW